MKFSAVRYIMVALSLVGSAILLYSCDNEDADAKGQGDEHLMTEYSENLKVVMSQNGQRSYLFEAPLVEGYQLAREPYREFRKGIKMTTYLDDSMSTVDAVLTANYAIYYEKSEIWEAKGNVVAQKVSEDKTLYTQQLFWNARTHRVYSNVDSKLVQNGGRDVLLGESFESDEEFKDWQLRRSKIRMEVEMKITEPDTTAVEEDVEREEAGRRERVERGADDGERRPNPAYNSASGRPMSGRAGNNGRDVKLPDDRNKSRLSNQQDRQDKQSRPESRGNVRTPMRSSKRPNVRPDAAVSSTLSGGLTPVGDLSVPTKPNPEEN